jgi:putative copper resistance protein D
VLWLVRDFDLLSVILRALSLSLEALSVGTVAFLVFVTITYAESIPGARCRRMGVWFAAGLAAAQVFATAISSMSLMYNAQMGWRETVSAPFFVAGALLTLDAAALAVSFSRLRSPRWLLILLALGAMASSVALSHAASRLDHRVLLLTLTAAHHLGTAVWLGAMPALLLWLRMSDDAAGMRMVRRYSKMALAGVALLVGAGIGMAYFYVGPQDFWQGIYGTSYGVMLVAKTYLLLAALTLGAANFYAGRSVERSAPQPLLRQLRRLTEGEIGLGFTAVLAAASLTAQSPAADVAPQDKLTLHEIVQQMSWKTPAFRTPAVAQLAPPTDLKTGLQEAIFTGGAENDANDRAWSEYNHHWAGLIVLLCGALAFVSRLPRQRWARHWPLLFFGLSAFILLRADPECWPLGPRPFWASFSEPDVLEHRLFAIVIAVFAVFEWGVETGRLRWPRAAYVFPAMCALGGALLLTHSHSIGDAKEEMFAEMTHTPVALLGATAGWGRWIELRLPGTRASRLAAWVWPMCLILIGLLLLNYREV